MPGTDMQKKSSFLVLGFPHVICEYRERREAVLDYNVFEVLGRLR